MDRLKMYFNKPFNPTVMYDVSPVPDVLLEHLRMVYQLLFAITIVSSLAATLHLFDDIGGWTTTLVFVASITSLSLIRSPRWEGLKVFLLFAAASFFGAVVVPLINFIVVVDQSDIFKVLVGTSLFFYCYSVLVISGQQRVAIYGAADFCVTILVPTWMVLSPTFLAPVVLLGVLLIPWDIAILLHSYFRQKFIIWFDIPVQVAWFSFLRHHFSFNLCYLVLIYLALWPLKTYMVAHSQECIYRARHGENYFLSDTIAFFTHFPALTAPRHEARLKLRNICGSLRHG